MGSSDMLNLRSFMIGASTCGIAYNLLQVHVLCLCCACTCICDCAVATDGVLRTT